VRRDFSKSFSSFYVSNRFKRAIVDDSSCSLMFTIPRVRAQKHPQPENGKSPQIQFVSGEVRRRAVFRETRRRERG